MSEEKQVLGWCASCGGLREASPESPTDEPWCVGCGGVLGNYEDLSPGEKANYRFQKWFGEVVQNGLNGPSPGGAATRLGCHRSMIDKLVDRGALEKSMYDKDGFLVVLISERSLKRVMQNKRSTGKWTDSGED